MSGPIAHGANVQGSNQVETAVAGQYDIVLPPLSVRLAEYSAVGGAETPITTSPGGEWSAYCSIGCGSARQRQHNDDGVCVHRNTPETIDIVVADGMGGYGGGAVASAAVVDSIFRGRAWELPLDVAVEGLPEVVTRSWEVYRQGADNMGTAYAAVVIDERTGILQCIHQGDVQVLVIDADGSPEWLSREHTRGQRLSDNFAATERADWSALVNYVGVNSTPDPATNQGDRFEDGRRIIPDGETWDQSGPNDGIRLKPGARVVVASDGIWDVVPPAEVAAMSQGCPTTADFLRALKDEVRSRVISEGAKDDNAAIVIYEFAGVGKQ